MFDYGGKHHSKKKFGDNTGSMKVYTPVGLVLTYTEAAIIKFS